MKVSASGLELIRRHEGLRLEAYPDPASGGDPYTIGFGHTRGVKRGDKITQAQAEAFLVEDLAWVEAAINRRVTVPLSQSEFDALASLIFNIGEGAFARSTLLRLLNDGKRAEAAEQFGRWVNAAGKRMKGLEKRRAEEAALFRKAATSPAPERQSGASDALQKEGQRREEVVHLGPEPVDYYPTGEAPGWTPPPPKEKKVAPFIAAALPAIVQSIPQLAKLFGSGSAVAERNIAAAEAVVGIVQQAVGASNAQEAAELVQSDPQARQKAQQAIESQWYTLAEAGGGGIDGARKADREARASGDNVWRSPSFIVALALLPLVYMVLTSVLFGIGPEWPSDVRAAIATAIISLVVGGIMGYYFGQTTSRNRTPQ